METGTGKQKQKGKDRQTQTETDRDRKRQTDTDTDGQRQTESVRDKNKLIQIREGQTDTDTDRRKLTVTKRAKDVMSNRTKILAPFFFSRSTRQRLMAFQWFLGAAVLEKKWGSLFYIWPLHGKHFLSGIWQNELRVFYEETSI